MGMTPYQYRGRHIPIPGGHVRVWITGEKELLRALRRLEPKLQRKALRRGMTKCARVLARGVKERIAAIDAVETGLLKKSIGHRVYTLRDGQGVGAVVGPRKGFRRAVAVTGKRKRRLKAMKKGVEGQKYRDPAKYIHLIELGTKHLPPRAFLRPSLDEARGMILMTLRGEVAREIAKAQRK